MRESFLSTLKLLQHYELSDPERIFYVVFVFMDTLIERSQAHLSLPSRLATYPFRFLMSSIIPWIQLFFLLKIVLVKYALRKTHGASVYDFNTRVLSMCFEIWWKTSVYYVLYKCSLAHALGKRRGSLPIRTKTYQICNFILLLLQWKTSETMDTASSLTYAGGHSDTGLLEALICENWVRVPVGERHHSSTDFYLNTITTT
jgi:hypothetical protein